MRKPNGYWTYERCKEVSLICETRNELDEKYRGAYKAIYKNKWIELFDHMKNLKKVDNYWSYEKCKEIVDLCQNKNELYTLYSSAYRAILQNKWKGLLETLSSNKKPNGYWNYERCRDEALKYKFRSDFDKNNCTAYRIILKNKWLELFDHMERIGNKVKRLIYVYEFNDNHCYIGLTSNKNRRHNDHFKDKDSSVYKHYIKTGIIPELYIKTDYIDVNKAIELEGEILNEYKENNWVILNQVKTGGIGSSDVKWNKETCKEEASKYTKITDFMRKSKGAYNTTMKYGWIDEFFKRRKAQDNYWNNKELCKEEALKYKNRSEFCYGSWSAYNYASINNWLVEFFPKRYKK